MKKILTLLMAGLPALNAFSATGTGISGPWSDFYSRPILAQAAKDIRPGVLENWQHVILPVLTPEERRKLEQVRFVFDLEDATAPINFYSISDSNEVHIPASSVRMLGDLTASWMWLNKYGYTTSSINEYLSILKYQWASGALRDKRYLPLEALGVPDNVRNDPAIADEYTRVISNILFFIIGHELGHLLHEHRGIVVEDVTASLRSIAQEKAADAFSLELMRRIGEMPLGVPLFFIFATALESASTDPDYSRPRTHPHSGARILATATALRTHARGFARGLHDSATAIDKVNRIADSLVNDIAPALESPVIQDLWRQKGLVTQLGDLKPRTTLGLGSVGTPPRKTSTQLFDGAYQGKWIDQKGIDFDVRMDLQRNGEIVVGSWTFGPNRVVLNGIVSDEHLYFDWKWGLDYFGKSELYAQSDGRLVGTWGYTRNISGGGTWSLSRPQTHQ